MSAPVLVDVSWAKGQCESYILEEEGIWLSGFMHPEGRSMSVNPNENSIDSKMTLFPMKNRKTVSRQNTLLPYALSLTNFSKIEPGSMFP